LALQTCDKEVLDVRTWKWIPNPEKCCKGKNYFGGFKNMYQACHSWNTTNDPKAMKLATTWLVKLSNVNFQAMGSE
jgi:hypothetical protein